MESAAFVPAVPAMNFHLFSVLQTLFGTARYASQKGDRILTQNKFVFKLTIYFVLLRQPGAITASFSWTVPISNIYHGSRSLDLNKHLSLIWQGWVMEKQPWEVHLAALVSLKIILERASCPLCDVSVAGGGDVVQCSDVQV